MGFIARTRLQDNKATLSTMLADRTAGRPVKDEDIRKWTRLVDDGERAEANEAAQRQREVARREADRRADIDRRHRQADDRQRETRRQQEISAAEDRLRVQREADNLDALKRQDPRAYAAEMAKREVRAEARAAAAAEATVRHETEIAAQLAKAREELESPRARLFHFLAWLITPAVPMLCVEATVIGLRLFFGKQGNHSDAYIATLCIGSALASSALVFSVLPSIERAATPITRVYKIKRWKVFSATSAVILCAVPGFFALILVALGGWGWALLSIGLLVAWFIMVIAAHE